MLNYIKDLFKKCPPAGKYKLDHSTENFDRLIELTKRMDAIELLKRKNEEFVSAVLEQTAPELLKRDKYGHFLFLEKDDAINILKKVIAKVIEE